MRIPGVIAAPPRFPSVLRVASVLPYALIHVMALGVLWVGFSWIALGVCLALYVLRMFVITGFYHRYFSHRTFRTHRVTQFVFAFFGTGCAQRGPIWWAAHHRQHHRRSDEESDIHSPHEHGLLWSHMGWFNSDDGLRIDWKQVPDWAKFPELVWLEKLHMIGPIALALGTFAMGAWLGSLGVGTSGWQMLVWGFAVSTVLLYHGTFTINSLAHVIGKRRFATTDDSRNNLFLSIITLGEGWHNNHHFYPGSVRQGFYWWEFDPCYYALWVMARLGLVWDLRPVPARVYAAAHEHGERLRDQAPRPDARLIPPGDGGG